ncbi:uncharacterized protein J3R85_006409 [Psidium guajava]|nr:uncharacterized protein J3R85_006409 [Psidium guajava]
MGDLDLDLLLPLQGQKRKKPTFIEDLGVYMYRNQRLHL